MKPFKTFLLLALSLFFYKTSGAQGCKSSFKMSSSKSMVGDSIFFTNTSNYQDSNTIKFYWNFGNGVKSVSENTIHRYKKSGAYEICLSISDSINNCKSISCDSIFIIADTSDKCLGNNRPVISGINCKPPNPDNFKINACVGEKLCFTVCTADKDKGDSVTIEWNSIILGATFTLINEGDKREKGQFCWTPTEAQMSKFPYSFVVTAKDNACISNGTYSRSFSITLKESPKVKFDTLIYQCNEARFTAQKMGDVNISQYMWNLSGRIVVHKGGDADTVYHHYKDTGKKAFSLSLIGANGCNKVYENSVRVSHVYISTTPDTTVNAGTRVQLSAIIKNNVGNYSVEWSTGERYENDGGKASITVGKTDTFVVAKVIDSQCENSDTTFIKVSNTLGLYYLNAYKTVVYPNPAQNTLSINLN